MLFTSLLRVSVDDGSPGDPQSLALQLESASERSWRAALKTLRRHRLEPLVWSRLKELDLAGALPPFAAHELQSSHLRCFLQNGLHMQWLDRVLAALADRGIEPVLLKGVALANTVYDTLGSRPMDDVDLYVAPGELPGALSALSALGFAQDSSLADTLGLCRDPGPKLDLHHRMRIFDGRRLADLSLAIQPRFLTAENVRILTPDATLVHLAAHLEGHRGETGYVLGWLVDLAFVFKRWGARISADGLRPLANGAAAGPAIRRAAEFVQRELGVPAPAGLDQLGRAEGSLTMGRVLTSRRLAIWGLPRPRGWLRLAAHYTGVRRRVDS